MARSQPDERQSSSDTQSISVLPIWRERLVGAILTVLAVLLGLGLFSHLVPDNSQFIGTLCRIADSMRPYLLLFAILTSIVLFALRSWRSALIGCLASLVGLGAMAQDYRTRIVPWSEDTDLRVLWFNILSTNDIAPDRLERELRAAKADIVVITEALPAIEMKDRLADLYPHTLGCRTEKRCTMMILSRLALEEVEQQSSTASRDRLFGFTISPRGHPRTDIVAAHLVKPWYLSFAGEEAATAGRMLSRSQPHRPLLMMGDFNAAPWSRRVRMFETIHHLRHPPRPVGTWPASLGDFGVPIDHMLVRRGVRFAWQEPWGGALGSNHRGLLAGIALPDPKGN